MPTKRIKKQGSRISSATSMEGRGAKVLSAHYTDLSPSTSKGPSANVFSTILIPSYPLKDIKRTQIAKELGVSDAYLCKFLKGERCFDLKVFLKSLQFFEYQDKQVIFKTTVRIK